MLISKRKGFVFVHVPRTGGKSITAALKKYADDSYPEFDRHLPARKIKSQILHKDWDDMISFGVIRNPWDLMSSQYWYMRYMNQFLPREPPERLEAWVKSVRDNAHKSFEGFVRDSKPLDTIEQYLCNYNGEIMVTEILRYENLTSEFCQIARDIGLYGIHLPHENATLVDGAPRHDYREDYTPDLVDYVAERFKWTIEFGNYQFSE